MVANNVSVLEGANGLRPGSVSSIDFRSAAGLFPSGVTVVTRLLEDDRPYGMTVSSFTSVSLEPPMILVCIDRNARFVKEVPPGMPFATNVLAQDQQALAERFSNRYEEDRFSSLKWNPAWNGLPLLDGIVASFTCSVSQAIDAGDHVILLGLVQEVAQHPGRALIWCERDYHCLPHRLS